jgi:amino acid transporter
LGGPWAKNLYNVDTNSLTSIGILGASSLLIFYFLLNYWSVKLFLHFISVITVFKIIVPIITWIMLIYTGFHPGNFTQVGNTITPYGCESILTAIVTCGIILSFNGFQRPVNLAGEAKRPHINLPLAIIFSILITMTVYLLLQTAFIGAVPPEMLAKASWKGINFHSPLVELALLLHFVAILVYLNSFIQTTMCRVKPCGLTW